MCQSQVLHLRASVCPNHGARALAVGLSPSLVPQSAKSNLNVDNVFFTIARDIKQRLAETAEERPEVGWGWEWVRAGVLAGW